MQRLLCVLLLALVGAAVMAAPVVIWGEGENPTRQQIVKNDGMMATNPAELSGGAWMASWSHPGEPNGVLEYDITVPADGSYHLWLRADGDTGLAYRLDGSAWLPIDIGTGVDKQAVAGDGTPWWPSPVYWFDLGARQYSAGAHTLAFQLGGGDTTKDRYAAIDCFCLTDGPFTPNKKYKPGETAPAPQTFCPGRTWDFTPKDDKLDPAALLDLRYLNEKVAGEHGFIRLSKDGNSLVRGDGQPIRFWAAVVDGSGGEDLATLKQDAQALAKRGVNLVRIFAHIDPKAAGAKITDVDEGELDGIFKSVAAFKSAGIYCTISPFWGFKTQASWNVNPGGDQGSELLYVDATIQAGYRAWMKTLLTRPNPYTGIKLADEPTAMLIEFQNEQSFLSWGLSSISGPDLTMLRAKYADYLKNKYGSLEKARAAWLDYNPAGNEMTYHPDWEKGIPPWLHVWDFTHEGYVKKSPWPGFLACSGDQLEFVAGIYHDFNRDMTKYLREELGCKQLVNCSNWKPADIATMQDTENWASSAGDVLAFHDYFGGDHAGVQAGWRFNVGDYYSDLSATKAPQQMPTNHKQADGHPYMLTEMSWTLPDLYQSEGPLMAAGQCSVTGIAACFWSTTGFHGWDSGGSYKWSWNTPELLAQFPAAALIYRTNMLREGAPVVLEHRSLADLWTRKTPLVTEGSGFDPNHPTSATATENTRGNCRLGENQEGMSVSPLNL